MIRVAGYCPMGCGEKLVLGEDDAIVCVGNGCPDPYRLRDILADDRVDHLLFHHGDTFTLKHPLRERPEEMMTCALFDRIKQVDEPPHRPGIYAVRERVPDGYSESYRSGDHGLEFEWVADLPETD